MVICLYRTHRQLVEHEYDLSLDCHYTTVGDGTFTCEQPEKSSRKTPKEACKKYTRKSSRKSPLKNSQKHYLRKRLKEKTFKKLAPNKSLPKKDPATGNALTPLYPKLKTIPLISN